MIKEKKLLFSLTQKDFEFETFCTGGSGGQHRNAKQNGVRVRHLASGAVTEHRDGRDQRKNKEAAFAKIVETKEFKAWHKIHVAKCLGRENEVFHIFGNADINKKVDDMMRPENLLIEEY